jgi:hypothetical protein
VDASAGRRGPDAGQRSWPLDNNPYDSIPVLNKVDLPSADVDKTKREIEDVISFDCAGAIAASAKTGVASRTSRGHRRASCRPRGSGRCRAPILRQLVPTATGRRRG